MQIVLSSRISIDFPLPSGEITLSSFVIKLNITHVILYSFDIGFELVYHLLGSLISYEQN